MFTDLRRICENPTDEDREWFPDFAGSDWLETLHFAMKNFKDESFIQQFLSPKVMRDLKLFAIQNDDEEDVYRITAIHDDPGYRSLREKLARQYNLSYREPNIQVWNVDVRGDRSLTCGTSPSTGFHLATTLTRCFVTCIVCGALMSTLKASTTAWSWRSATARNGNRTTRIECRH